MATNNRQPQPLPKLNPVAIKIAIKLIKGFEGCELRAYPDPASELYQKLSDHNILRKFMDGKLELPPYLQELSGTPWTIGYGDTSGVKQGDVWLQEDADKRLQSRVIGYMQECIKVCPEVIKCTPQAIAAVTSLTYNIGVSGFSKSTVVKKIKEGDLTAASDAFLLWNKSDGKVLQGLSNRRKIESDLFRSLIC